jgi:heptosyltransferase-1
MADETARRRVPGSPPLPAAGLDRRHGPGAPAQGNPGVQAADRILVIRLGALGDVIRTLPAVEALRSRYPGAHLTWLVEPGAAGVVDMAGFVDETMVFPREDLVEFLRSADGLSFARQLGRFLRRLRGRRFDLVLDFHGILKSGLLARFSGAPIRYGYGRHGAREFAELFANRRVDLPNVHVSRYERNAALLEALVPDARISEGPFLVASALAAARLTARLGVSGREKETGFVLIHPGSSPRARHKRYAPAAWAEIARRLSGAGVAVWIATAGGRHDRTLVDEILRLSDGALVPAPETREFDDLLALLARASVFVSCDSGPLHAASLSGVPVVQLLGPTDPIQNEPWRHSPSRRAHVPLPCSPCRRGCSDPACMRVIPPALVVEKILQLHVPPNTPEARAEGAWQ